MMQNFLLLQRLISENADVKMLTVHQSCSWLPAQSHIQAGPEMLSTKCSPIALVFGFFRFCFKFTASYFDGRKVRMFVRTEKIN